MVKELVWWKLHDAKGWSLQHPDYVIVKICWTWNGTKKYLIPFF